MSGLRVGLVAVSRFRVGLVAGVFALSGLSGIADAPTASACSCVARESVDAAVERLRSVPGVFTGTAVRRLDVGGTTTYEFTVREVFAGDIGSRVLVSTPSAGATCGAGFAMDREQMVLVTDRGGIRVPGGLGPWYADACLSTVATVQGGQEWQTGQVRSGRELVEMALGEPAPPGGPLLTFLSLGPAAVSRPFLTAGTLVLVFTLLVAVRKMWKSIRSR